MTETVFSFGQFIQDLNIDDGYFLTIIVEIGYIFIISSGDSSSMSCVTTIPIMVVQ